LEAIYPCLNKALASILGGASDIDVITNIIQVNNNFFSKVKPLHLTDMAIFLLTFIELI
jgi:hypothetical protein